MLKRAWKTLLITSIVTLLPIPVGLILWKRLPDVMATHFGMNNEANGFSSKPFAVFFIPLFCLAMLWICAVVTANDPRKQNISPKIFNLVLWIIPVVSLICGTAVYTYNLGQPSASKFPGPWTTRKTGTVHTGWQAICGWQEGSYWSYCLLPASRIRSS